MISNKVYNIYCYILDESIDLGNIRLEVNFCADICILDINILEICSFNKTIQVSRFNSIVSCIIIPIIFRVLLYIYIYIYIYNL